MPNVTDDQETETVGWTVKATDRSGQYGREKTVWFVPEKWVSGTWSFNEPEVGFTDVEPENVLERARESTHPVSRNVDKRTLKLIKIHVEKSYCRTREHIPKTKFEGTQRTNRGTSVEKEASQSA